MIDVVKILHEWSQRKMHDRCVAKWGMTRQCPWCRQCVETDGNHSVRTADHCEFFDTFTCGNCGGESHWEFGPFPFARGVGNAPNPADWAIKADAETKNILKQIAKAEGDE